MHFLCYYLGGFVLLCAMFFGANLSQMEAGILVIGMVIFSLGISGTAVANKSTNSNSLQPHN